MSKQFKLIPIKEFEEFLKWKNQTETESTEVLDNPDIPAKIKLNILSNNLRRVNDEVLSSDQSIKSSKMDEEVPLINLDETSEAKRKDPQDPEGQQTPVVSKPPIYPKPMEKHPTPDTPVINPRRRYASRADDQTIHKFVVVGAQIPFTSKRAFPSASELIDKIKANPGLVSWDGSGKLKFKNEEVNGYLSTDLQYFFTTRQGFFEPPYISKWWRVFHWIRFDGERIVRDEAKKRYRLFLYPRKGPFNFNAQTLEEMLQLPTSPMRNTDNFSHNSSNVDLNQTIRDIELSPNKFAALRDSDNLSD